MKRLLMVAALCAMTPMAQSQQPKQLMIFGGQGHKEFLGCLNCAETHAKSVFNESSNFGFANRFGVWSRYGEHLNRYGSYSMCYEYASDPPVIVDNTGDFYGRLTVSQFTSGSVCASFAGNERLCRAIKVACADD